MTQATNDTRCLLCEGQVERSMSGLFDTRFGIDAEFEVGTCTQCGAELTFPIGGAKDLEALYAAHYNFSGETGTLYTRLRDRALGSRVYKAWLHLDGDVSFYLRKGTGRLLDVGCNEGRAMLQFRRNGWETEGLELNPQAANAARLRGFTVHEEALEELQVDRKYDVVVMSNVLEHVRAPAGFLRHAKRVLRPGGEIWISCPNATSWLRRVFGRYWINWHVPFHLVHFSEPILEGALENAGLQIHRTQQVTPTLWVAQSLIARMFAIRGRSTSELRNPLLVVALVPTLRLFMHPVLAYFDRTGRGDCIVVTARNT